MAAGAVIFNFVIISEFAANAILNFGNMTASAAILNLTLM